MVDDICISFLRHGLTEDNIQRRYLGWSDVPLSKEAIDTLKKVTLGARVDAIYSSNLKRCKQTARLLFGARQKVRYDSRLRELNFGDWERKTYEELKHLSSYRNWIDDPFKHTPDNGEAFSLFCERVIDGVHDILTAAVQEDLHHIAVVSHGGPLRAVLTSFLPPREQKAWWDWQIDYLSGYRLTFSKNSIIKGGLTCISLREVRLTEKKHG